MCVRVRKLAPAELWWCGACSPGAQRTTLRSRRVPVRLHSPHSFQIFRGLRLQLWSGGSCVAWVRALVLHRELVSTLAPWHGRSWIFLGHGEHNTRVGDDASWECIVSPPSPFLQAPSHPSWHRVRWNGLRFVDLKPHIRFKGPRFDFFPRCSLKLHRTSVRRPNLVDACTPNAASSHCSLPTTRVVSPATGQLRRYGVRCPTIITAPLTRNLVQHCLLKAVTVCGLALLSPSSSADRMAVAPQGVALLFLRISRVHAR
jgi:hypothetical protein